MKTKKISIHLKKIDWLLLVCVLILVGFGLLSLYSSSLGRGSFFNFYKQLIFLGVGFLLMFSLSFFNWRVLQEDSYLLLIFYLFSLLLLIGLFFFAPEIRGVKSWYKLGPFSVDPIEITKIILIILLSKYFSKRHIEMYQIKHVLISGIYVLIPAILIFFQPNLGSALIIIALWIGVLVISGIKIRHFLVLLFILFLVLAFSWSFLLKDYQKARILSFIQPQLEPLGMGWSQAQAKIAIGSGGIFGQGLGQGSQTQHGFLPEPQTDFIFAAIAEEFGLIGISAILLLFTVLIWRIVKIALMAQANFPRLFASGFAVILVSQIFINVGMNLGILPIVGIPLPLISYGGSSLIAIFLGQGILQSIRTH